MTGTDEHDGEQVPACPHCESRDVDHRDDDMACGTCGATFTYPVWLDVTGEDGAALAAVGRAQTTTCSVMGCERDGSPVSDGGYRCERHPWVPGHCSGCSMAAEAGHLPRCPIGYPA